MASLGALTTPGTRVPLAILDMGGGSTDAALIDENGHVNLTHCAGAGELVSMLIQTELGLGARTTAEQIKKYPLAKVESLFHLRLESGEMQFFDGSIDPRLFGHVVLMSPEGMIRIDEDIPMEKIVQVRREAKRKVFVTVYNEGEGIPEADVPFVFDRFYKSDKSRGRDKTGAGLGLYISKTIMEAHGEELTLESVEGKSCAFTLTLPLAGE